MQRTTYRAGLLVLAPALLVGGCVTTTVGDAGTSFGYAWWVGCAVLAAFGAATVIGIRLLPRHKWLGLVLVVAGLVLAPIGFLERVDVDANGFSVRSGIWGRTATHDIAFDTLLSIAIGQEDTGGKASRRIGVLVMTRKDGSVERFALNNDVKIEGAKEIIKQASARRVPVRKS